MTTPTLRERVETACTEVESRSLLGAQAVKPIRAALAAEEGRKGCACACTKHPEGGCVCGCDCGDAATLRAEVASLRAERDALRKRFDYAESDNRAYSASLAGAIAERDALRAERDEAVKMAAGDASGSLEIGRLRADRDALTVKLEQARGARCSYKSAMFDEKEKRMAAESERDAARAEIAQLRREYDESYASALAQARAEVERLTALLPNRTAERVESIRAERDAWIDALLSGKDAP